MRGEPKKGGGGGKGTWGRPGDEIHAAPAAIDSGDPNYVPDEVRAAAPRAPLCAPSHRPPRPRSDAPVALRSLPRLA